MESIDYGTTDLNSVIEGEKNFRNNEENAFKDFGYTQQEFDSNSEELKDVEVEEVEENESYEEDYVLESFDDDDM